MLAVVQPRSFVAVALNVAESALSIGFVVVPLSLVHITCWMNEPAITLTHIFAPHTLIDGPISILDGAKAMFDYLSAGQSSLYQELAFVEVTRAVDITELVHSVHL